MRHSGTSDPDRFGVGEPLRSSRLFAALEPAHALARVGDVAKELGKDGLIVMNVCGRGDKDIFSVAAHLGMKI